MVAKGHSQPPGIEYQETFAQLVKFTMIQILLAQSCENDCEIEGTDVNTAYINGGLEETIYIEVREAVAIPTNKEPMSIRHQSPAGYLRPFMA